MKITGVVGEYELLEIEKGKLSKSILQDAQDIIYGDREKTYGAPDKNLRTIADMWRAHIRARHGVEVTLDTSDVCLMMVLLKAARLCNDPSHRDSQVDGCGYFALMERIQKQERVREATHFTGSQGGREGVQGPAGAVPAGQQAGRDRPLPQDHSSCIPGGIMENRPARD